MSIAGIWLDAMQTTVLYVEGQGASFNFRAEYLGSTISQGLVQRGHDGSYVAQGQGINGPVKAKWWLSGPDVLMWQNQFLVDGGVLDNFLGSFVPGMNAMQPVMSFNRQAPARVVAPLREVSTLEDLEQLEAEEAAERAASQSSARDQTRSAKKKQKALPDRTPKVTSKPDDDPIDELRKLIGMSAVKEQVEQLDAWAWRQQELKSHAVDVNTPSLHMVFSGGPGTGKTTVARIIGRILSKHELLEHGRVREVGRPDLVAEYVGQTGPKTEKLIEESLGGVLFIDEAYALSEPGGGRSLGDYGAEALAVLIAGMENHRHELCVIVAGYSEEMERFMDVNAGMASRISRRIRFPDFTEKELLEVFKAMAASDGLHLDPQILTNFIPYIRRAKAATKARQWGNARTVRNIFERGIEQQSLRLRKAKKKPTRDQLLRLEVVDFPFFESGEIVV